MKEIFTRKIGRGDNKMVKLKVGRNIIELDEKDLILDNGACYQIVTKKVGGFDWYYPIMSKKLFHDLKKLELIGNLTLKECKNLDIKSM